MKGGCHGLGIDCKEGSPGKDEKKPEDETRLGFGDIFTDHMFLMDYEAGKGWINPRI